MMSHAFIVTKEHRRFTEFANAVRKDKTIGICHGPAGVGKTNSARRYANWDIRLFRVPVGVSGAPVS